MRSLQSESHRKYLRTRLVKAESMLTMDLKELGKNVGPGVEYLRSRLDEPVKAKGSRVTLAYTNARTAKMLLHKFLRQSRLEGYRILVVHPRLIEVHAPEKSERTHYSLH
jgi:hypothetical protein